MLLAATAVVCKAVFVVGWIALRVVGSWPVLLLGLGIVILFLPDALGPLLSWVLTHKVSWWKSSVHVFLDARNRKQPDSCSKLGQFPSAVQSVAKCRGI